MRTTVRVAASLSIPFLLSGCVESSGGDTDTGSGSEGSPAAEQADPGAGGGVAERGERGGPEDADTDGEPVLEIGGVKTEATAGDTVELFTREVTADQGGDDMSAQVEWEPRLSLTFTAAEREGDDVTFHGQASYLLDDGAYTLHAKDFTVLVPNGESAKDAAGFDEQYEEYLSDQDGTLVTLTPEEPDQDFAVTVADVPPEDDAQRHDDGTTGRYVQYETPEELWGHEVQVPQDYVPGRLCYVEGDGWHDVPLFDFSDIPCG